VSTYSLIVSSQHYRRARVCRLYCERIIKLGPIDRSVLINWLLGGHARNNGNNRRQLHGRITNIVETILCTYIATALGVYIHIVLDLCAQLLPSHDTLHTILYRYMWCVCVRSMTCGVMAKRYNLLRFVVRIIVKFIVVRTTAIHQTHASYGIGSWYHNSAIYPLIVHSS